MQSKAAPRPRIEATHFIEQYNRTDEFKMRNASDQKQGPSFPIGMLSEILETTAKRTTIHTVAIFKIKFK